MNTQDFERLKAVCEKDAIDFCDLLEKTIKNAIDSFLQEKLNLLEKKDPWDGVEFILSNWGGKIYPINQICNFKPDYEEFTPSNESLYVRQLISEANKRFGEIKEGDRFDFSCFNDDQRVKNFAIKIHDNLYQKWEYIKKTDSLLFYGFEIYQSGKWATRVKERVEVKPILTCCVDDMDGVDGIAHLFSFDIPNGIAIGFDHHYFLAKQLEEYLNKE